MMQRPSSLEPSVHRLAVETCSLGQIFDGPCVAIEGVELRSSLIDSLFCRRGPSAVTRFVVAIVVHAINRMFGARTWPHVCVEGLKRVQPSLTDRDTATSVPMKIEPRGSRTAIDHVGPCEELGGIRHAVCGRSLLQLFHSNTSTRVGSGQISKLNHLGFTAIASTQAGRVPCVGSVDLKDGQSPVFLSVFPRFLHNMHLPYFALVGSEKAGLTWL